MSEIAVVILAAGSGTRFGHKTNKVWLPLGNSAVISHCLKNARAAFPDGRLLLVIDPLDEETAKETLEREVPQFSVELVYGGSSRHESELHALRALSSDIQAGRIDVVLIHDGARPLASPALFRQVALTARAHGGALPAIEVDPSEMDLVIDERVARVQTPQAFRAKEVLDAYLSAEQDGFVGTDTAACMERYFPASESIGVPGEISNIKITYPHELDLAEQFLTQIGEIRG